MTEETPKPIAPWVQLHAGLPYDLLTPTVEQVSVPCLIRSICRLPRFNGHTVGIVGYSVGQHSILVAELLESWGAPSAIVREGLLHDLPEGVYGDLASPLLAALTELGGGDAWRELRRRSDVVVRTAMGLPEHEETLVKRADVVALAIERRDLMAACDRPWNLPEYAPKWPALVPTPAAESVEWKFLDYLKRLDARISNGA